MDIGQQKDKSLDKYYIKQCVFDKPQTLHNSLEVRNTSVSFIFIDSNIDLF